MSHFYATIEEGTRKTVPSSRGHKSTGIATRAASWAGAVCVRLWWDEETQTDRFEVTMERHKGKGDRQELCRGIVGDGSMVQLPAGRIAGEPTPAPAGVPALRDTLEGYFPAHLVDSMCGPVEAE